MTFFLVDIILKSGLFSRKESPSSLHLFALGIRLRSQQNPLCINKKVSILKKEKRNSSQHSLKLLIPTRKF